MSKNDHDDEPKGIEIHMLKASGLADLCRGACTFSERYPSTLFSFDYNGKKVLARTSHHMDSVLLVNYVEMPYKSRLIKYTILPNEEEKIEFVEDSGMPQQGVCYIDVVRADLSGIKSSKALKKDDVINIQTGNAQELVKSLITKLMHSSEMPAMFAFEHKKNRYIAAFDVFADFTYEKCLLCYAKVDNKSDFNFIKYNFETNSITYEKMFGGRESNTAYVKVLHLTGPFPFFEE